VYLKGGRLIKAVFWFRQQWFVLQFRFEDETGWKELKKIPADFDPRTWPWVVIKAPDSMSPWEIALEAAGQVVG
jgi:hypothetical protein